MDSPKFLTLVCVWMIVGATGGAFGQECTNIGTPGETTINSFAAKASCDMPDGAYVPPSSIIKLDVTTTATGHCTWKGWTGSP